MPQLTTMTSTSMTDSDHEDRFDMRRMTRLDIEDIPSEHPGTENSETPFLAFQAC